MGSPSSQQTQTDDYKHMESTGTQTEQGSPSSGAPVHQRAQMQHMHVTGEPTSAFEHIIGAKGFDHMPGIFLHTKVTSHKPVDSATAKHRGTASTSDVTPPAPANTRFPAQAQESVLREDMSFAQDLLDKQMASLDIKSGAQMEVEAALATEGQSGPLKHLTASQAQSALPEEKLRLAPPVDAAKELEAAKEIDDRDPNSGEWKSVGADGKPKTDEETELLSAPKVTGRVH